MNNNQQKQNNSSKTTFIQRGLAKTLKNKKVVKMFNRLDNLKDIAEGAEEDEHFGSKAGLGALGLATAGAISYGLYKKKKFDNTQKPKLTIPIKYPKI